LHSMYEDLLHTSQ